MSKIKKGDAVVVIAGKDKSKFGTVDGFIDDGKKVVVEGINIVSRHTKGRKASDPQGILKRPAPIDASNVMLVCSTCNKATRVTVKIETDEAGKSKKVRYCKKCGACLDVTKTKAKGTARRATRQARKAQKLAQQDTNPDSGNSEE